MFNITVQNRRYDLHRPSGCTVLLIEVEHWPGNEFGLWLPETIWSGEEISWCNWKGAPIQIWEHHGGLWTWEKSLDLFSIKSTLEVDELNSSLRYKHTFKNHSNQPILGLSTATCFHLVNAPEFISIHGERIWACLDNEWITTDRVPRHKSPDPRRVSFLRDGTRTERVIIPSKGFPSAVMEEAACHPLIVAENFNASGAVAIASKNFERLFNNNDPILRCIHSESSPLGELLPGEISTQEGMILFSQSGYSGAKEQFERAAKLQWVNP